MGNSGLWTLTDPWFCERQAWLYPDGYADTQAQLLGYDDSANPKCLPRDPEVRALRKLLKMLGFSTDIFTLDAIGDKQCLRFARQGENSVEQQIPACEVLVRQ